MIKKIISGISLVSLVAGLVFFQIYETPTVISLSDDGELEKYYNKKPSKIVLKTQGNITEISHQEIAGVMDDQAMEAPETRKQVLNEKMTLLVPDRSEQKMKNAADKEKMRFLIAHLNADVLDNVLSEYGENRKGLLSDMGVPKACDESGACRYKVMNGPILEVGQSFGLLKGDEIVAINDVDVSVIPDYALLKDVLFSNSEFVDVTILREGQTFILRIG